MIRVQQALAWAMIRVQQALAWAGVTRVEAKPI